MATNPIEILLVEDNPAEADLALEGLKEGGKGLYAVTHVQRVADALQALDARRFVLILLDLSLPDSHGIETVRRVHERASGAPIVVLTGRDDGAMAHAALAAGAQDYLVKRQVQPAQLVRAIEYSLERASATAMLEASTRLMSSSLRSLSDVVANLIDLARRQTPFEILTTLADASRRLRAPAFHCWLMHDPGTDGWYTTAALDVNGVPLGPTALGLPEGPFHFACPQTAGIWPLVDLLTPAVGVERAAAISAATGVTNAICAPIEGPGGGRGALLALLGTSAIEQAPLLTEIMSFGASRAAYLLERDALATGDGVLEPAAFNTRATAELDRMAEHDHSCALTVIRFGNTTELQRAIAVIARAMGRWDILGRMGGDPPALAVLLPEARRTDALALLRGLGEFLPHAQGGAAVFPEDGAGIKRLAEVATGRAVRLREIRAHGAAATEPLTVWVRGAPTGPDVAVVRCPECLAPYSCRDTSGAVRGALERARSAARTTLHASCPRHAKEITVHA